MEGQHGKHGRKDMVSYARTLGSEKLLLCGLSIVDGIEGERELFGFVFGVWNLDHIQLFCAFLAISVYDNISLELLVQQWPDSRNNPNRHV